MATWSFCEGAWQAGDCESASCRWFQLSASDSDALQSLAPRFGLHPLAVEDCLSRLLHPPKLDEFRDHLFIVLVAVVDGPAASVDELDVFLGRDFLITYADVPLPEVEAVALALSQGRPVRPGADGLFYEIADRMVDGILPEVNALSARLEALETAVLQSGAHGLQSHEVVESRARAGHIRRLLSSQLTATQRLARGEFPYVAEANRIYFRDVYDHLVRVDIALEAVREDAEVVLSTYLAAVNNRMNEVMKVLSVVAALALPATVISGIFGTNFDNVPGLHSNWGFVAMIVGMASLAGSMALYFRRRGWF
jgi:magnesium transporter